MNQKINALRKEQNVGQKFKLKLDNLKIFFKLYHQIFCLFSDHFVVALFVKS